MNEPSNDIIDDGLWRPEAWRGRYLVVRHVRILSGGVDDEETPTGIVQRELLNTSKFGSQAQIFESLETAEAMCDKLNTQAAEEARRDEEPSSNEEPTA